MTETKRLSLAGRLRMASVVRGPDTDLMIEAADAIEQHEAFRQEVSDAVVEAVSQILKNGNTDCARNANAILSRFIIPKPDPLVEAWIEATGNTVGMEPLNAAIEKRGGKIVWEQDQ